ncbi:MAG: hypothetical protein KBT20_10165 [Bacteroidales bacterium]|nr:hypothetical protein [Candidatus Liminaster caballi]
MKEKILNAFKNLGFEMENMEGLGYGFNYEGLHYLWVNNDDEEFLSIAIPAVFDKSDVDELDFYKIIEKLNSTLKYVKVNELSNSMWIFYEREMVGEEDFDKLLPKMILHLEHAVRFLRNGGEEAASGNDDEETASEDSEDDDCIIEDVDLLSDND